MVQVDGAQLRHSQTVAKNLGNGPELAAVAVAPAGRDKGRHMQEFFEPADSVDCNDPDVRSYH